MPVSKHYSGHGAEVMREMIARYGEKKGKEIFYATENKRKKQRKSTAEVLYGEK